MSSSSTHLRLEDVVENADAIAGYIAGMDEAAYMHDRKTQDAVERCLGRITEAIIQIGAHETDLLGLGVAWGAIRGLGNRLRHEYRRIDGRVIFAVVRDDLPPLREAASRALLA